MLPFHLFSSVQFSSVQLLAAIIGLYTRNTILLRLTNEFWSMVDEKQWDVGTIYSKNANVIRWAIKCATTQTKLDDSILHWIIR